MYESIFGKRGAGGMTPKFMEHIHIDVPKDLTPKFDEFGDMVVSTTNQMIVQQVESIDDAICKQIHDMAVANGIDDVYVLDKKQILSALEKQIPKKPKILTWQLLIDAGWKHGCPNCGCAVGINKHLGFAYEEYLEPNESFCCSCGQALGWSDTE
jgi:hypothetical protein